MNRTYAVVLVALVCALGCAPPPVTAAGVQPPPVTGTSAEQTLAWNHAKQTFDQRCVVCHGCYDAPCQLLLSSFDGMQRGATKHQVYDAVRLLASEPTRIRIDAHDVAGWRHKKFYPVLPEGPQADPQKALLVRMLDLKREFPLPLGGGALPPGFELGLDRKEQCPQPHEFEDYAEEHPLWGMPYALPALSPAEHASLVDWVKAGAPHRPEEPLVPAVLEAIERWEAFFNQGELKAQLSARYMYEHLFLASLYFAGVDEHTFFRMVRSRTPTGQPIEEIATRRPFEDPGTAKFYYRISRRDSTPLGKTLMPYPLSDERLAYYRKLFLDETYDVKVLPKYAPATSANPFAAFAALPVKSRYRFMLEEAHFTISGFIKGPVCRGQVALDVIDDRFWIAFVDPDSPVIEGEAHFLEQVTPDLSLPAEQGSNNLLLNWRKYAKSEERVIAAKARYLAEIATSSDLVTLAQIWKGDGTNQNAALTVLRHFDSATVVKGFVGGDPKTTWVMGYPLLERIHYLLVAGFDVFGNVGHQLQSRLYMDFLRMEAEHNFLLLLPKARRRAMVDHWYRQTGEEIKDMVYGTRANFDQETGIEYRTALPERELDQMLVDHLRPVLNLEYGLDEEKNETLRQELTMIELLEGKAATLLPETSFLELRAPDGSYKYFTLLRDTAHLNVAHLFSEDKQRATGEDRMKVLRGFVGVYPNALFTMDDTDLPSFVKALSGLDTAEEYDRLRARFGVRRNDARFWALSDRMHAAYRELSPLEAGLFDYNRLDGR